MRYIILGCIGYLSYTEYTRYGPDRALLLAAVLVGVYMAAACFFSARRRHQRIRQWIADGEREYKRIQERERRDVAMRRFSEHQPTARWVKRLKERD